MINLRSIDELAQRLAALVPPQMGAAGEDLGSAFRTALSSGLARMNLVTREEFDVQRLVLLRTREKVEALEKQLAELQESLARRAGG